MGNYINGMPVKIYANFGDTEEFYAVESPTYEDEVEYIRYDIVEELFQENRNLRLAGIKMYEDLVGEGLPNCHGAVAWREVDE